MGIWAGLGRQVGLVSHCLLFLPYGSTSYNSVIPSGKTLIFSRKFALVRGLDAAHMLDDLQDLHIECSLSIGYSCFCCKHEVPPSVPYGLSPSSQG